MRRMLQIFYLVVVVITVGYTVGCGGGAEPNVPASLTPEQEQEILDQVEGAAAQEQSQS